MPPEDERVDEAALVVAASPAEVYAALATAEARAAWLAPAGMEARVERFDLRVGGGYRMVLTYLGADAAGKTTSSEDVVDARFLELQPGERVVEAVRFVSDDPAFAGTMRMTWSLAEADGGTRVSVTARDVPRGIDARDHVEAMESTLGSLAAFLRRA